MGQGPGKMGVVESSKEYLNPYLTKSEGLSNFSFAKNKDY